MSEREQQLVDYLLDLLEPQSKAQLERDLEASPELRQELEALQAAFFQLPQGLKPVAPAPSTWSKIQTRLPQAQTPVQTLPLPKPLRWRALAAAAAVLALFLGGWGIQQYQLHQTVQHEREAIGQWLVLPGAEVKVLKDSAGTPLGSVIILPDDRCLLVLQDPPQAGKVYQAWERDADGVPVSMGVFKGRTFETRYTEGAASIGVSLEPPGGSPQPTQPLGRVPLSYRPPAACQV